MLLEGRNAVKEALNSDTTIEKILIAKGSDDNSVKMIVAVAKKKGVRVDYVDRKVLDKTTETGKHQGVIAYTTEYKYFDLEDILAKKDGRRIILLLDGIEDPHNLGSIIRAAECHGVDGVVIPKMRSASVNETVIRASCGATQYVKVVKVTNINDVIRKLKDEFIKVVALDMQGERIDKAYLDGDIALVVGNEGNGVSRLTLDLCDEKVSIPMLGEVSSLNASVATGIALYECCRQLRK